MTMNSTTVATYEEAASKLADCKWVAPFSAVRKEDAHRFGGKVANLGELTAAGFPVPPGFGIAADACNALLDYNPELRPLIDRELSFIDTVSDRGEKLAALGRIQSAIRSANVPRQLAAEIKLAYQVLKLGKVAVRSAGLSEDSEKAALAGLHDTKLNIQGADDVIAAYLADVASFFNDRAIEGRSAKGLSNEAFAIGIAVQAMVQSDRAGIAFSIDKVTGDRSLVNISAVHGIGELAVAGRADADFYKVAKDPLDIVFRHTASQQLMLIQNPNGKGNIEVEVPDFKRDAPKLTEDEIIEIAAMVVKVENHYGSPQDTEWTIEDGVLYFVQARPVTGVVSMVDEPEVEETAELLLVGLAGAPGVRKGTVRICHTPEEANLRIQPGDIGVMKETNPDCMTGLINSAGFIGEIGTPLSHMAIEGQSHGKAVVVSAAGAMTKLHDGQVVVVDGSHGKVYAEDAYATLAWGQRRDERLAELDRTSADIMTKTKLGVIAGDVELAAKLGNTSAQMVNLLRIESAIESPAIGRNPEAYLEEGNPEGFIKPLEETLEAHCVAFEDKGDVVARTFDAKLSEIAGLRDSERFEDVEIVYTLEDGKYIRHVRGNERNFMLGNRGAFREIQRPGVFAMQCEAFRRVWSRHKNLIMMFPFVRTPDELEQLIAMAESHGLKRSEGFRFWMMVEVPSNVVLLEEFASKGIVGISIGTNDLTQLFLGMDRDNGLLRAKYTERDPAVQAVIRDVLRRATKLGLVKSLCGQMVSNFPDTAQMLVEEEIDSIGVIDNVLSVTRRIVADTEARLAGLTFDAYQAKLRAERSEAH